MCHDSSNSVPVIGTWYLIIFLVLLSSRFFLVSAVPVEPAAGEAVLPRRRARPRPAALHQQQCSSPAQVSRVLQLQASAQQVPLTQRSRSLYSGFIPSPASSCSPPSGPQDNRRRGARRRRLCWRTPALSCCELSALLSSFFYSLSFNYHFYFH
jgi:hypothetical protein